MRKIRFGIDIQMWWTITTNGENTDLAGRELVLELCDPYGVKTELPFTIEGNVAHFTFFGMNHKRYGRYSLTMWENRGEKGQNAVDKTKAFQLVRTTEEMGGEDEGNLKTYTVNLGTSDFQTGSKPYDDTEIRNEISRLDQSLADTHLIGATSIGGGGANENDFK